MDGSDQTKLVALVADIEELYERPGSQAGVCVDAVRFMDGNEDCGSIGCNLIEHPGPAQFREVINSVSSRPDVSALIAHITEVMDVDEGEWPFSDKLFIATTADPSDIAEWFASVSPDEISAADVSKLIGVPSVPPGVRWYSVWWD